MENERLIRQLVAKGGILLHPPRRASVYSWTTERSGVHGITATAVHATNVQGVQAGQMVDLILTGEANFEASGSTFSVVHEVGHSLLGVDAVCVDAWWDSGEYATSFDQWVASYALARLRGADVEVSRTNTPIASQRRRSSVLHDFWRAAASLPHELAHVLFVSFREFHGGPAALWALGIRDEDVLSRLAAGAGIDLTDDHVDAVREFSEAFLDALAVGTRPAHLVALTWTAVRSVAGQVALSVRAIGTAASARLRMLRFCIQRHAPPLVA